MVIVQVIDTGRGPLTEMPVEESGENSGFEGLGLSLIKHLIGDLDGSFTLRREGDAAVSAQQEDGGRKSENAERTVSEVRFPLVRRSHT